MNRKEKIALGVVVMIFLIVMIAVFWDYVKYYLHKGEEKITGKDSATLPDLTTKTADTSKTPVPATSWTKVLKVGVFDSPEVKLLQKALNQAQPANQISEDGDFGPLTEIKLQSVTGRLRITLQEAYSMMQNFFQ